MGIQSISGAMEKYVMPIADKMGNECHLRSIRDAFMSLLPITFIGGIAAVISSAPSVETAGTGFTLGWAKFVANNSMIFSWINALTLGTMSLYICIGIIHFLCKTRKIESFLPILLGVFGFMMLIAEPLSLGWDGKTVEISFMDGKGLVTSMLLSIVTADLYCFMRKREFGKINLPDTVPASLSDVFASIVPGAVLMGLYILVFAVMNKLGMTLPKLIYQMISPSLTAVDNLGFTIIITLLVHIFWFFGIHDAALAGILAPIRDGNLSLNAAAHSAGQAMPSIFTTPFWVYFVVIGGCGSVLALSVMLSMSKSKQLKTIGRMGIIPAFFNISEPVIFGLPLMLNPIFFIPFLSTSVLNGTVAFLLMKLGFVGKSFAMLSWQMPSVIGAFFSTMDWKAPILIIVLIILDGILYFPFFKIYEKKMIEMEQGEIPDESDGRS
ncbi:PTS sugar transporter subunit IIC [Lacrimispora sp.]|uniref:PTS sugar transporter subunit IIC n=1 Tax=Lacrimispora sp. TaxID=2719234 RepID=UPI0028993D9F|nr:PTS transporter subunit EIIC [Lacrimispora sp.]